LFWCAAVEIVDEKDIDFFQNIFKKKSLKKNHKKKERNYESYCGCIEVDERFTIILCNRLEFSNLIRKKRLSIYFLKTIIKLPSFFNQSVVGRRRR